MRRCLGFLIVGALFLTACTPEKLGAWIRTQSGAISSISAQAKDAVQLTKIEAEKLKAEAEVAAERARKIQEGLQKMREGQALLREGLTGTGSAQK